MESSQIIILAILATSVATFILAIPDGGSEKITVGVEVYPLPSLFKVISLIPLNHQNNKLYWV